MKKRLLSAAVLATTLGFGLLTTASFANGPLMIGPAPVPVTPGVHAVVNTVPVQTKVLSTYRQVRAFWLSRALVR
ncbi:hypothetical protein KBI23_06830 [bacterium]|jgi:hypothetical protein|nr:hypothetical protein [Cyanobacteria bacterium PR.023]MBP6747267.1 hypothetical protein [bacterium]MBP9090729.1 hypothetical protein [bacterium]MBP9810952.1 hypothetical protein [bacterium]MDP3510605.1 hypothetical protein [Candidatus Melainabacteria bacterium]